jgi:multiple sugar transport system permease protein
MQAPASSIAAAAPSADAARPVEVAETAWAYVLSAPALLLMTVLLFLPVVAVCVMALTDWQLGAPTFAFVGLRNFAALWRDPTFHAALINTAIYVAIVVPVTVILGLAVALLVESAGRLSAFYRAIHFLPFMATMAAMALAWEALLHPTVGLVNHVLGALGLPAANWLRDKATVLGALAAIGVWQLVGYVMVLFLAGLKAIPEELYDAAEVDGADGVIDRLQVVTLPMLGPVTMFVVIVTALKALQVFDTVRVLTHGGPGDSSNVLLHLLYVESFEYLRTGYGSAISVVFLLMVVVLTVVQARTMDRRVHYT